MKVPSIKLSYNEEQIAFVMSSMEKMLREGAFLSTGDYCNKFENEFAKYVSSKHAIATSSSTSALEILLRAYDVSNGKIIVSTNTYPLAASTILRTGCIPVFADIGDDLSMSIKSLKEKLSNDVKAVITMHPGGLISPELEELRDICLNEQIPLIEDAHYAHGSELNNKKAGILADGAVFSFFSPKPITTGEGGMITLNDQEIFEKALYIKNIDHETAHKTEGYEWKMTEMQAIMGIVGLNVLEDGISKKGKIFKIFDEILNSKVSILKPDSKVRYNNSKYIVFLPSEIDRISLRKNLKEKYSVSLSGSVYEIPCHLQQPYVKYGSGKGSLPKAEKLCSNHVCLPIYPSMTDEEASYAAESFLSLLS